MQEYAGKNNRRGQWLVVLVGINPPQIILRLELRFIQRDNIFVVFIYRRGLLLILFD